MIFTNIDILQYIIIFINKRLMIITELFNKNCAETGKEENKFVVLIIIIYFCR